MSKRTICLDFDGVIHSYVSGWKGAAEIPDPPVPGAMAFIHEQFSFYRLAIYSSRSHQEGGIDAMKAYIRTAMLAHLYLFYRRSWPDKGTDEWNDHATKGTDVVMAELEFPTHKPSAHMSIDDRGYRFEGVFPLREEIDAFKPWTQKLGSRR